jgi:putative ABC transport system permease protein
VIVFRLLTQTVFLALGQIWANKVRALLTTLGIIIGVAAVISVVSATNGFRNFILSELSSVGANKVWIFPRRPPEARDRFSWRQIRMTAAEADGIKANAPSIERLTPVLQFTAPLQYGDRRKAFVPVYGIRAVWHDIEQRSVTQGRPFSAVDEEHVVNVCLVNDKAVEELALPRIDTDEPVFVLLDGRRFLVIGIVETKNVAVNFGPDQAQSEIFIPFKTAQSMRPESGIFVIAQTFRPEQFQDARAEVTFYMRKTRGLQGGDPDTFGVQAIEQFIEQFNRVAVGITAFTAGIVAISLLVGGIGIMNIMLVSVSERTREIGLRKAVGAQPAVILLQFLVEAIVLCLVGAAIGLALGQGIVLALRFIPDSPLEGATTPGWAVVLSVGFSVVIALVFGMFPAIKAARLDPIEALRHE